MRQKFTRLVRRFPASTILLTQYLLLVLTPALIAENAHLGFILRLLAVAVIASLATEIVIGPLQFKRPHGRVPRFKVAAGLTAVGLLASVLAAWQGAGSYETQLQAREVGPLASLFTPLVPFAFIGAGLGLIIASQHPAYKRPASYLALIAFLTVLSVSTYTAILAPAMSFALGILFLAAVLGLVRARTIVALAILVGAILWPVLFSFRNENRLRYGAEATQLNLRTSSDRLRLDRNMTLARLLPAGKDLGQPSFLSLLRYGFIPRAIDRGRPTVATGTLVTKALGGSELSSTSLTVVGNVYLLDRQPGVIVYFITVSLFLSFLIKRSSPYALLLAALTVSKLLWIESSA